MRRESEIYLPLKVVILIRQKQRQRQKQKQEKAKTKTVTKCVSGIYLAIKVAIRADKSPDGRKDVVRESSTVAAQAISNLHPKNLFTGNHRHL